MSKKIMARTS